MPRLSRTVVAEREAFTNQNFAAGMTMEQANDALVKRDKHKMNPYRLKELFDAVKASTPVASFPDKPVIPAVDAVFTSDPIAQAVVEAKINNATQDKPVTPPLSFTRVFESSAIISKRG